MFFKRAFHLFGLALFFAFSVYADDLNSLAFSKEWLALGHYQKTFLGGYKATPDSQSFFNASDGRTNPLSELKATIELFNSNDEEKKCFFPARYKFLLKNSIKLKKFPKCQEYEQFKEDLSPRNLTLLYTDAYMNNPSSLFGHVLFRIDTSRKGTQLMAHGVNYGALVDRDANGLFFAILGLTGGYMGSWTVRPYYDVINLYNNIENRDIWEFPLNLTDEELDFLIAHLWEIGHTQARYFFFSRNCAYMLLELLDATRSDLGLADAFKMHVIPVATLKVLQEKGMILNADYRPSRQRRIQSLYDDMSQKERKAFLKLIFEDIYLPDDLTDEQQARVLQTAYEYFQYAYIKKDLDLKTYRQKSFFALKKRTQLPSYSFDIKGNEYSPLMAHNTARVSVSQGIKSSDIFTEFQIRPAYHTLNDSSKGLLKGAEINLLDASIRYYEQKNRLVLQSLDIVSLRSLSPVNAVFRPISYNLDVLLEREENLRSHREGYVYNMNGGAGQTYALSDQVYFFWFFNTYLKYGGFLPTTGMLGFGLSSGLYGDFEVYQFLLKTEGIKGTNSYLNQWNTQLQLNKPLSQNLSLYTDYTLKNQYHHYQNTFKIGVNVYF